MWHFPPRLTPYSCRKPVTCLPAFTVIKASLMLYLVRELVQISTGKHLLSTWMRFCPTIELALKCLRVMLINWLIYEQVKPCGKITESLLLFGFFQLDDSISVFIYSALKTFVKSYWGFCKLWGNYTAIKAAHRAHFLQSNTIFQALIWYKTNLSFNIGSYWKFPQNKSNLVYLSLLVSVN